MFMYINMYVYVSINERERERIIMGKSFQIHICWLWGAI